MSGTQPANITSLFPDKFYQTVCKPCLVCLFVIFCSLQGIAQDAAININDFRNFKYIDSLARYELTLPGAVTDADIPGKLIFANFLPSKISNKLPDNWVEQELFLKFTIVNDTTVARVTSFYPGMYFTKIKLFRAKPGSIASTFTPVVDSAAIDRSTDGYKMISLEAGEKAVIFVRLRFLRSSQNTLVPMLMKPDYIDKHRAVNLVKKSGLDVVTYLASGMMLMMIIYSVATFIQNRRKEFLYYALYAFFTGLLLFLISFLGMRLNYFNFI
ncbi:MAG: hypothetical protein EOO02_20700 [Chitinophagaceae bacterium]|nr:MAG: hypothetical protein EOO02_20700 [Chitinophagaceae bacterium]